MRIAVAALAFALLVRPADAQEPGTVEQLAPEAFVLLGKSGNVLIVPGKDGALLIDDERESDADEIRTAVKRVTQADTVRMVVNTHWHLDHSGGNAVFASQGAVIVAQRNVRARRATEQFMSAYNRKIPPAAPDALPHVVFDDRLELYSGNETVRLLHVPAAHTDGDTLVKLERANVLHMGDVFFNGLFPFIDRDSGGSIQGLIKAVDAGLALADEKTRVVPAHGDLTDKAGLLAYRRMLQDVLTRVQALRKAGKTLAQVQAATPTANYRLEGNAERFVAAIYDSAGTN